MTREERAAILHDLTAARKLIRSVESRLTGAVPTPRTFGGPRAEAEAGGAAHDNDYPEVHPGANRTAGPEGQQYEAAGEGREADHHPVRRRGR